MDRFKKFMKLWMRSSATSALFFILFLIGLGYYLSIKAFVISLGCIILGLFLLFVGAEAVDAWKNSKETK